MNDKEKIILKYTLRNLGTLCILSGIIIFIFMFVNSMNYNDNIEYNNDYLQGYNDGLDDCITERNVMLEQFKPKEGCNITIFDKYTMREDCN